jgi:hypothetical protein
MSSLHPQAAADEMASRNANHFIGILLGSVVVVCCSIAVSSRQ